MKTGWSTTGSRDDAGLVEDVDPRGAAARERILDAAVESLSENGFNGVSLSEVARRAGFTRSGLLHHFASREILLREALGHRLMSNAKSLHDIESATADQLLDSIIRMIEFTLWVPAATQAYQIIAAEAVAAEHPAHAWFAERHAFVLRNTAASLQRSVDVGEARADLDVHAVSLALLALSSGLQFHWLHDPDLDAMAAARYQIDLIRQDIHAVA